jgi:hypothetical protein
MRLVPKVLEANSSCTSAGLIQFMVAGLYLTVMVVLEGCVSLSYVDSHDVRHVVGLVDVAIRPNTDSANDTAASAISVTSFGLAAYSRPGTGGGLVVGFNRETYFAVANHACVDLNRPGPCAKAPRREPVSTKIEPGATSQ